MSNEEYEEISTHEDNDEPEIDEIQKFEDEIQNEIKNGYKNYEPDELSELSEKVKRLPKKERLIQSILKFETLCSDIVPTENKLRKTKIAQLEKLLARCISVSSGLSMKNSQTEEGEPEQNPGTEQAKQNCANKLNGAEMLFMANVGIISVVEQLSRQTSEYTGVEIDGWSSDVKDDKENLMLILEAVYRENADVVSTYMSPSSMWALYMMHSGASHLKKASDQNSE